jgi:hypothetical protein
MASTDEDAPDATSLNRRWQKALSSHVPTHKHTIIIEIKTEHCIEYKKALDSFVIIVTARIVSCFAHERIQQPTTIPLHSQERFCRLNSVVY